jgi:GTPase SAR1 family protein
MPKPLKDSRVIKAKETVRNAYAQLSELASTLNHGEVVKSLAPDYRNFEMGLFRLVVMGEIKKGKSTFINALLNEPELLPTASDIATSTVYKIIYGAQRRFRVYFKPDIDTGARKDPITIDADALREWGTEAGNPGNEKRVDFIGVELPNPLLNSGLVIVDTPGVGGLIKKHRDITLQYAPNADAILFVLDSVETVISQDEIDFLQYLLDSCTKRIFFVQTKTDAKPIEEWEAWKERNTAVLMEKLGIPKQRLVYFPVSAKTKLRAESKKSGRLLQKSGYLDVQKYLHNQLLAAKEWLVSREFAIKLDLIAQRLETEQRQTSHVLREESKEKLKEAHETLQKKKSELGEWTATRYQAQLRLFNDNLGDLKRKTLSELRNDLDPNGTLVSERIDSLDADSITAAKISDGAEALQQDIVSSIAMRTKMRLDLFNSEFLKLVENTLLPMIEDLPESLRSPQEGFLTAVSPALEHDLGMHFSSFENVTKGLYGGMAGMAIASMGVGLAALVCPPLAVIAGMAPYLGGLIGGVIATKNNDVRQKMEALSRLKVALTKVVAAGQRSALEQLEDISVKLERNSRAIFEDTLEQMQKDLQCQITNVQTAAKSTREKNEQVLKQTTASEAKIRELRESLRELLAA